MLRVTQRSRGTGPRATVAKTAPFTVGRGPVPRHATTAGKPTRMRGGHPRTHARRSLKRSRGTGPRATEPETAPFNVGRGPVPRRALGHARDREGQALALRARKKKSAGDRPPRYDDREIAGDRPPRYGIRNGSFYRRARACPSPCNDRGTGPRPMEPETSAGDRPPRYETQNDYFCRFTSPNVVSIRFDAETGPRNIRIAKVSGLPSNATSSI